MPLLDLKTDLKSLKYGKDRPGGGDSGQPYQQVDINTVDRGFNRFRMTKFDDGLVRGGVVGAANASIVDTFRIGKFLKDFPKGPLFIVKQIGLQLSNPQLETKKLSTNNPTKGGGLLRNVGNFVLNTANKIVNAVGPTRIYNLGINTLAQIPVNAFGQHFNRHGLLPVQNEQTKYLAVVQNNNNEENNRLTGLRNRFGLGTNYDLNKGNIKLRKKEQKTLGAIAATFAGGVPFANSVYNDIQNSRIADYIGGPNSVYGIGRTLIKRTPERTNDSLRIDEAKNKNYNAKHIPEVKISSSFDFGISLLTNSNLASSSFNLVKDTDLKVNGSFIDNTFKQYKENKKDNKVIISNDIEISNHTSSSLSSNKFKLPIPSSLINNPITYDGGKPEGGLTASADLGLSNINGSTDIPKDINDINKSLNQNVINYSNPALKTYTELRKKINKGNTINQNYFSTAPIDKVNKKAKQYNVFVRTNDTIVKDDTLALQFTPLDPFTGDALTVLKFLGYINNYSEDYNSGWNSTKYIGRAENFYIFNEFKRTANISFNIPCYNYNELLIKHCHLSELASTLAGKYKDNLLLGGIITKLKVGNYINNQPGIITNLNFSPIQDSSWDLDAQLAFYLKVDFGFTLIHNYLPQYTECGFIFKEPDPITPPPPPPPSPPPPPPTPPVTSSLTPSTGSYLDPIGRVDLRDRPDKTYVKKPYILDDLKKVTKFGGGSFGGGGATGDF
jgi:hypothetical protein